MVDDIVNFPFPLVLDIPIKVDSQGQSTVLSLLYRRIVYSDIGNNIRSNGNTRCHLDLFCTHYILLLRHCNSSIELHLVAIRTEADIITKGGGRAPWEKVNYCHHTNAIMSPLRLFQPRAG
jgi:hypothetical protein